MGLTYDEPPRFPPPPPRKVEDEIQELEVEPEEEEAEEEAEGFCSSLTGLFGCSST